MVNKLIIVLLGSLLIWIGDMILVIHLNLTLGQSYLIIINKRQGEDPFNRNIKNLIFLFNIM